MIAPARESDERSATSTADAPMLEARRTVATVLWPRGKRPARGIASVPRAVRWALFGWLIASAVAYVAILGGWWS